ncbi:WD40/YVTN/BNR-like repeat-containing protein [uncultured Winogradskyella sp.]|uniref:WD40/YVTN/BNR-like repeat-containing protein n=1 Tax=uncultured Winogradskyella sp. TaxID=395353 RepID=UPI003511C8E4
MRLIIPLLILTLFIFSCEGAYEGSKGITRVEFEHIFQDSTLSVRALDFNDEYLFYGSADHIGKRALTSQFKIDLDEMSANKRKHHFKHYITYKNDTLHFRAIEEVNGDFFAISIENPARLYRLRRKSNRPKLVYEEIGEKVFYDAMAFWNDKEGIAIGDPVETCMSIIITRDGGETWTKIPCEVIPEAKEGEGAFAASDTNIAIAGDKTWVATGGKTSRILYSGDEGKTWESVSVPIIQGKTTTRLYSIDFYDEKNGFAIGGDYTQPDASSKNKLRTKDGGQTWHVVADGKGPGYRSCVQYVPNSKAEALVAVGFKGIDYSNDAGDTWIHLSDEPYYTIRFIDESTAYAAGKGRISKITFK